MLRPLLLMPLLLLAGFAPPEGAGRLTLVSGEVHRDVRLLSLDDARVRFAATGGDEGEAAAEELVSLVFPGETGPVVSFDPEWVEVLLRGGDVFRGALLPAGPEKLGLRSPLLGELVLAVDDVAEVRFVKAWNATEEKPVYAAGEADRDVFVYENLDRLVGTFLEVEAGQILVHGRIGDRHPIAFGNLLAIRFADAPAPPVPEGRRYSLLLSDGSRLTAPKALLKGAILVASTERGEDLKIRLDHLRALWQSGGRFVFLSDRKPADIKFTPWIGESYAWDRPRFDRSLLDRPLMAGGQAFEKGVGVLSGTTLTFDLDGTYARFTARVAVDDAAGTDADVVFEVLLDGQSKWKSETVKRLTTGNEPLRIPPIDLGTATTLALRVDWVDDFVTDYADWIEPMLVR